MPQQAFSVIDAKSIAPKYRSELSTAVLLKIEADEDRFFDQIITGDETWVYQYDPETK